MNAGDPGSNQQVREAAFARGRSQRHAIQKNLRSRSAEQHAAPAAVIQRPAQLLPRRLKLLRRFRVPKLVQPREFQQNVEAADKRPRPASYLGTHNNRWRFLALLTYLPTLVSLPRGNKPPRALCTHLNNRFSCGFGNIVAVEESPSRSCSGGDQLRRIICTSLRIDGPRPSETTATSPSR